MPCLGVIDGDLRTGAVSQRVGKRKFEEKVLQTSNFETQRRSKITLGFAKSTNPPLVRRCAQNSLPSPGVDADEDDDDNGGGCGDGGRTVERAKRQGARQAEW